MKTYQLRVKKEKLELDAKAKDLSEFIGNSELFLDIPSDEQEMIREQCEIMWLYSEILGRRIDSFKWLTNKKATMRQPT